MLHVDPADPRDPVAQVLLASLSRELAERYPGDNQDDATFLHLEEASPPRGVFLLAWFGTEAVGCGALRPFPGDAATAEIKRMFVAPASRGKGIGREILQRLEAHARSIGYTRIVLETGKRQPEAIALYERGGYSEISCYPPYDRDPQSLCFERHLPEIPAHPDDIAPAI